MIRISLVQAILCGIIYWLAAGNLPFVGVWTLQRPLVCGTIIGLILGNPVRGAEIGGMINLVYLGYISAGGSMPADMSLAGILGTVYGLCTGMHPLAAVIIALPFGYAGRVVWNSRMTIDSRFARMTDQYIENERYSRIWIANVLYPQIFCLTISAVPCTLAAFFGVRILGILSLIWGGILQQIPLLHGIILYAGGVCCLHGISKALSRVMQSQIVLMAMVSAGFISVTVIHMQVMMLVLLAIPVSVFCVRYRLKTKSVRVNRSNADTDLSKMAGFDLEYDETDMEEDEYENDESYFEYNKYECDEKESSTLSRKDRNVITVLPRKALIKAWVIWETFPQTCYNYERMMGQAVAHMFVPLVPYVYKDRLSERKKMMKRISRFFNVHVEFGACVPGLLIAVEERRALGEDVPEGMIEIMKASFMGPVSGAGDDIWQGAILPIMLAACIDFNSKIASGVWGTIVFAAVIPAAAFCISYYFFMLGYRGGSVGVLDYLEKGIVAKVREGANISGCLVIGGLIARCGTIFDLPGIGNRMMGTSLCMIVVLFFCIIRKTWRIY